MQAKAGAAALDEEDEEVEGKESLDNATTFQFPWFFKTASNAKIE